MRYILYLNDDTLFLLDKFKDQIYKKKCNYIKKNEIQNPFKFYFEWNDFIKTNKIKIALFGYSLKVIVPTSLNEVQKEKYKEIFLDYFKKVEFIYLEDILPLEKDSAIFNINEDYLDFYYLSKNKNQSIQISKTLFKNEYKAIAFILNTIYSPKKLILYGNNENVPKLTAKINKDFKIQCTFQEDYNIYVLNVYKSEIH